MQPKGPMARLVPGLAAITISVVLSACGGPDNASLPGRPAGSSPGTGGRVAVAEPTQPASAEPAPQQAAGVPVPSQAVAPQPVPPTVASGASGPQPRSSEEYCRLSHSYRAAASRFSQSGSEADLPDLFREANRNVMLAVGAAPDEIRPHVEVVAAEFGAFVSALEGVGFDFTRVPDEAFARFESPAFVEASEHVAAYDRDVCGLGG